jgi:SSS family solute:Na+ symporter
VDNLGLIDIFIILIYFLSVLIVSILVSRGNGTTENYFLAGRQLGWIAIGTSLFATNISSEHFIGLAGFGATKGMAVANIEWLAIIVLLLLAWFFAPLFLKAKVFTVPEFFGKRFNNSSRLFLSILSISLYIMTKISISLFAGSLLLNAILGWDLYTSAIIMMIVTGVYTIIGGLRAVVYTSVLQAAFLLLGAVVFTFFCLNELGGLSELKNVLPADYFSVFRPASDSEFPWTGIVFGAPILAIWYWCTDQYIVQKILSAKSISAARSGAILTAFMKILPVFVLVIPGLIAAALFPGINGNEAYPTLLNASFIPVGVKGLVLAGVLAALMSSLSSTFISTSTLFTMDLFRYFQPNATDKKLVLVGRLATTAMVFVGILWIPIVKAFNTHIYVHLQSTQAYFSPPIAAVFLLGIFWKRINSKGAFWGLTLGTILGIIRLIGGWININLLREFALFKWFFTVNYLHFAVILFGITVIFVIVVSILSKFEYSNVVNEYIVKMTDFTRLLKDKMYLTDDSRPDRYNRLFSAAILIVLIGLWGFFF